MSGMKELVQSIALIRGIPKTQAQEIVTDVIGCMTDAIIEDGGICIKDCFTIKTVLRKGRTGVIDGRTFKTEPKKYLSIHTGKRMMKSINVSDI